MRPRILVAAALLIGSAPSASPDVTVAGDKVSVQVQAMPASVVLDRIARATGMKVSFEGGTPRAPVTLHRNEVSAAEAVMAVMEGLGLSYALIMDESGARVDSLVVLGGPVRPGAAPPAARSARPAPVHEEPEETPHEVVDDAMEMETEEPQAIENPDEKTEDEAAAAEQADRGAAAPTQAAPPGPVPYVQPTPLPWPPATTTPAPTAQPRRPVRDEKQDQ